MITILLVENDPVIRATTREILELTGYQVLWAEDGLTGLRLFQQHRDEVSLVISDVAMPQMEGEELFLTLQAICPRIKMILVSGFPLDDGGQALLAKGLSAWIKKPFPVLTLLDTIEQVLADELVES